MFPTGPSQSQSRSPSPQKQAADYYGILGLKYLHFMGDRVISPLFMEFIWPQDGEACAGICRFCKQPAPVWDHECGLWAYTNGRQFLVPCNKLAIAVVVEAFGDAPTEVILYTKGWRAPIAVVRHIIEGPYRVAGPTPDCSWTIKPEKVSQALDYFYNATPIDWWDAINLVEEQRMMINYKLGLPLDF